MDTLNKKGAFDLSLFFTSIILWTIGVLLVYSATYIHTSGPLEGIYKAQVMWVLIGLCIMLIVVSLPTRFYYSLAYVAYGVGLVLLLYGIVKGVDSKGAVRWISVAGLRLQPSEFAKLGLLLALAKYLSKNTVTFHQIRTFILPAILVIIPFILVLKQPDLGTALVFCTLTLPMFYWAGMPLMEVYILCSPGLSAVLSMIPLIATYHTSDSINIGMAIPWGIFFVVTCFLLYKYRFPILIVVGVILLNLLIATSTTIIWSSFLKDYQKARIISFINPQEDPFGSGYQVIQSKVAIGSGHIFGAGYLQGSQTRLNYLPEQHTDFIFSVLGEQFGLIGCVVVLLLLLFVIIRGIAVSHFVRNRFTNLLVIGATTILAFHVCVNIAMAMGMMPVTGLPLPFLSYGGSFTFTIAILIGFMLNARVSNQDF